MPSEGPMLAHSIRYNIAERGQIVRLTCEDQCCLIEKENHMARVQATQARLKLRTRQKALHRRQCHRGSQEELTPNGVDTRGSTSPIIDMPFEQPQTRSIPGSDSPRIKIEEEEPQSIAAQDLTQLFPLQCQPTQCTFCLGNTAWSYADRTVAYSTPHKMMNHVERHLSKYKPVRLRCPRLFAAQHRFPLLVIDFQHHRLV